MLSVLTIFNSLTFIIYGLLCLFTDHMINEFARYRLTRFRKLTGALELLGGMGCILGYFYNDFLFSFSCGGLAILMTMGTIVRIKVSDPPIQILPAIILGFLNYYLIFYSLN